MEGDAKESRGEEFAAEKMQKQIQAIWHQGVPAHHGEEQMQDAVYVMKGQEQPLLGLLDAQRLGIIQMNMEGAGQKVYTVKQPTVLTGTVSGPRHNRRSTGTWR